MTILNKLHLLEINVISAQDLEVVSRKMKTYATARVNPSRKLTSSIDKEGHNNPTWNDKFVFRVDEHFLREDTSSVLIEIYSVNWLTDTIVGSVNVLVGNLIPPPPMPGHRNNNNSGMRFIALQVRRPSGRPQGILNIGVALLDSSMRSMPLYSDLSASAVGYRDLMDEDHLQNHQNSNHHDDNNETKHNNNVDKEKKNNALVVKPILRRTKSERSERVTFENTSIANSSILAIAHQKGTHTRDSSILSISDVGNPFMKKTTKASSVISGYELSDNPKRRKGGKGKSGSVLSDSVVSKDSLASREFFKNEKVKPKEKEVKHEEKTEEPTLMPKPRPLLPATVPEPEVPVPKAVHHEHSPSELMEETGFKKSPEVLELLPPPPPLDKEKSTKLIAKPTQKFIPYDFEASKADPKYGNKAIKKPTSSIWSDSEVGPSPSEVAAFMAEKRYPLDDAQSSVLDGWSLDESVEGLRSKLDRWRTELPPIYDRGGFSSSYQSSVQRPRRHSASGSGGNSGQFSCFGNFFGYECQCVCGRPPSKKHSSRYRGSPSVGSRSYL